MMWNEDAEVEEQLAQAWRDGYEAATESWNENTFWQAGYLAALEDFSELIKQRSAECDGDPKSKSKKKVKKRKKF